MNTCRREFLKLTAASLACAPFAIGTESGPIIAETATGKVKATDQPWGLIQPAGPRLPM